ncbi:hypothetical protein D9619_000718 [Psilocybe cf. subviscida]|uniref:Cytochrome c oxidase assembly factor 3 n=1 Tax=Psilocybe cf. subviscida TaxID=2480587 RepID=A0A8H5F3A3_9AGAR|nr:hypothetical protein D9619_000718 [Psilocybe cf. subviscida]
MSRTHGMQRDRCRALRQSTISVKFHSVLCVFPAQSSSTPLSLAHQSSRRPRPKDHSMPKYVDSREAAKSYRPVAGMSPGLKRAREPYRVKNAILGLTLGAFAVGVWAYSISAVKQDVFDDMDDEVVQLKTPAGPASVSVPAGTPVPTVLKDSDIVKKVDNVRAAQAALPLPSSSSSATSVPPARGVLQHLDKRWSTFLDPKNKTLVWGAPPVDNMGKMSDS